jgi:hypothetical protein
MGACNLLKSYATVKYLEGMVTRAHRNLGLQVKKELNDLPKFTNTDREGGILKKYIRRASQTSLFAEGFRRQLILQTTVIFTEHRCTEL